MSENGTSIGFLTEINEPDDLPISLPDGIITFMGGSWFGQAEAYGLIDFKVAAVGLQISGHMWVETARDLVAAIQSAIYACDEAVNEYNQPHP